jgi:lipoprotein-anchoring transpeptidase ErfK/SrfK
VLTVTEGEREVLRAPVGVGTTDTPTPGGRYYLKELLQPPTPDGPYGPYAYGLSGFSNVLTSFAGGEGVIGIHGTDAPDLVGTDVSNGCLRLANDVVVRLVEEVGLPLGTPVVIRA